MKKSRLVIGASYLLIGVLLGVWAALSDTNPDSLFWALSGAGIAGGSGLLWKYIYWTRPRNKLRYQARLDNEHIELNDERKVRFRDKSGRYAYIIGLIVLALSIFAFSILRALEVVSNVDLLISYLSGFLIFQYILGIISFNYLNRKY